ncbi:hypothetical protein RHGRI_007215 [Rhododendron griersonianum]|uniref:Uncharacterized protein n=1 Tax=Rhododendron griersonianum TaxID=479676 RepID=A0AAV6KXA3_9ERIC|nr:hypothetical protein RHGRI_007215 [Rhododendron griersonianum]
MKILDSKPVRLKGRPPSKRMQGVVEKIGKKKREPKKKTLPNKNAKEVEDIMDGHVFGTQESVVNVNVRNFFLLLSSFYNSFVKFHVKPFFFLLARVTQATWGN